MTTTPLQSLAEYGQSVWIKAPACELIRGRRLEHLTREHGITGVISDHCAVSGNGHCDDQIRELARAGETDPATIMRLLTVRDAKQACDRMLSTWQRTGGRDGYVSLDCDLRPPDGVELAVERAKLLQALVGRPNLLVKLPATIEGVRAVEEAIGAGVSVDVTPIFSPQRHREAVEAYVRGLERLLDRGGDPAAVTSVASVSISPVDVEVDRCLERVGGGPGALRGRLAIANARLAYQQYSEAFCGPRWHALEIVGARPQRCLWASTSPKPGAYSEVFYVEELIGADTITALSPDTIEAFEESGLVADRLGRRLVDAQTVADDVRTAGVDLDDVWGTLEAESERTRIANFDAAVARVAVRCEQLAER